MLLDGQPCRRGGGASWVSMLVIACVMANAGWAAEENQAVVDIGTRKQLFVNDHVVAVTKNVYRILNQPVKHAAIWAQKESVSGLRTIARR